MVNYENSSLYVFPCFIHPFLNEWTTDFPEMDENSYFLGRVWKDPFIEIKLVHSPLGKIPNHSLTTSNTSMKSPEKNPIGDQLNTTPQELVCNK